VNEAELRQKARNELLALFTEALEKGPDEGTTNRYTVRCLPGQVRMRLPLLLDAPVLVKRDSGSETDDNREVSDRIKQVISQLDIEEGNEIVSGTASSTSVDWYGTEMDLEALTGMEAQFNAGVTLFPRHGGFLDPVDWPDEFGRTVAATITRSEVAEPFDEAEPGWILEVASELFTSLAEGGGELARSLVKRLGMKKPQPIGMSIGGWFLAMTLIRDEDTGDLVRIIVHEVLLDHLAVVRNPANPDSTGLKLIREVVAEVFRSIQAAVTRAASGPVPPGPVEIRQVGEDIPVAPVAQNQAEEGVQPADITDRSEPQPVSTDTHQTTTEPLTVQDSAVDESASRRIDGSNAACQAIPEPGDERTAEGETMDPEMKALLEGLATGQAAVTETLSALGTRIADLEERAKTPEVSAAKTEPEVKPEPEANRGEDPAVIELRAQMEALKTEHETLKADRANQDLVIGNLVGTPSRRGTMYKNEQGAEVPIPQSVDQAGPFIRSQLATCKADGRAPAVRSIVEQATVTVGSATRSAFDTRWKSRGDKPGTEGGAFRQACADSEELLRNLCRAAAVDGTGREWIRAARDA